MASERKAATSSVVDWIAGKRDGRQLTAAQIQQLISQFMSGQVTDYQLSAWLMAVFFQGLSLAETVALTEAMLRSGKQLVHGSHALPRVDKHSTGGVGDKISLCLAPLVAACGIAVPMISRRGLGHTGGTLDKLEVFPAIGCDSVWRASSASSVKSACLSSARRTSSHRRTRASTRCAMSPVRCPACRSLPPAF